MELYKKIGSQIRARRRYLNISQKELAEKLKTKQSKISKIENGKEKPSLEVLNKIALALNTNLNINFEINFDKLK